jgi:hypothetical protein
MSAWRSTVTVLLVLRVRHCFCLKAARLRDVSL